MKVNFSGIREHMMELAITDACLSRKRIAPNVLANMMRMVKDPIQPMSLVEARKFSDLFWTDTNGAMKVYQGPEGFHILRYTKDFSLTELRVNTPYLIATSDGRLIVAKKMDNEKYTIFRDEEKVMLHPTNELNGSKLLEAIGGSWFQVERGKIYEYLEFLPGIDLCTAKHNGLLKELAQDPDNVKKLLTSIGIALAQAYIIGMGDRFGGLRLNARNLNMASYEQILAGEKSVCFNIDLSSALDDRVFGRGIANFLNTFCFRSPKILKDQNKILALHEDILEGFIIGYEQCKLHFERNKGLASDVIREYSNSKAERIFANLMKSGDEIQAEIRKHTSEDHYLI